MIVLGLGCDNSRLDLTIMVTFRRAFMILDTFNVWGWANSRLDLTIMLWVRHSVMILDRFMFEVGPIRG